MKQCAYENSVTLRSNIVTEGTHNSAITHITHRHLITVDEVIRKWAIRSNAAGKWFVATLQVLCVWIWLKKALLAGWKK